MDPSVTEWKLWCRMVNRKTSVEFQSVPHARTGEKAMDSSKSDLMPKTKRTRGGTPRQEVRCAVRFPLTIPATFSTGKDEQSATTRNVSASGVLLVVDRELRVGEGIRFSLRMPGDVLGAPRDVLVRCSGRVVRCNTSQDTYQAAATIDEYRFVEQ